MEALELNVPAASEAGPEAPAVRLEGRALAIVALVLALASTLVGQHDRELWGPDEMREAGITLAMARTGDYVTPRLNGKPFLEKPPLFHAIGAAVFRATGSRSRLAVRLPAILCGLATLGATYLLARRISGRRRFAALATLALATTGGFISVTHRAVTDNAIPPLLVLAFLALEAARAPGATWRPFAGLGLAVGFAFLAKGALGPAIFVVGALAYLAWRRELRLLIDPRVAIAAAACLVPIAGWLLALHAREGIEAVRTVVITNNWTRATGKDVDHAGPYAYYLGRMPEYLLPWTPFALVGAALALRDGKRRADLAAAWFMGGFLLLTAATAKRPVYLLSIVPPAAILAAAVFEPLLFEGRSARLARAVTIGLVAITALGLAGAAIADGVLRRDDILPWVIAGLASAALGAALGAHALRRDLRVPLAALIFVMTSLAFAFGNRARAALEDRKRGFDEFAAAIERAAEGREVVLFRTPEMVRGAASFYLDRTVAEADQPADLLAARARAAGRGLAVVDSDRHALVEETLGAGRVAAKLRVNRNTVSITLYD